ASPPTSIDDDLPNISDNQSVISPKPDETSKQKEKINHNLIIL
ncbi:unnamed protein product, partial [Rotaria sp. Silwood2]